MDAIANCYKYSGLIQHKFFILQLCRLGIQYGSHRAKVKVLADGTVIISAAWWGPLMWETSPLHKHC